MYLYKYFLTKNFNGLDIDIINIINKHIRVIEPPSYDQLLTGLVNEEYDKDFVLNTYFLNYEFYIEEYKYAETIITIKRGRVSAIYFIYQWKNNTVEFYIDFKKSFINPKYIQLYEYDDVYYKSVIPERVYNIDFDRDGDYVILGKLKLLY